jgi:hypothetical protein
MLDAIQCADAFFFFTSNLALALGATRVLNWPRALLVPLRADRFAFECEQSKSRTRGDPQA